MGTDIRPEISKKSPYYISKHRYYELKHFCLQYKEWKAACRKILLESIPENTPGEFLGKHKRTSDGPTALYGRWLGVYGKNIDLIESCAKQTDPELAVYILKAVTDGVSFKYLDSIMHIPCGKDLFYDRYRKFFHLLSKEKTY